MDVFRTLLSRLSWRLLLYWVGLIGGLTLFVEFSEEVYEREGFPFDEPVLTWFYGLLSPALTTLALLLSTLGGTELMIALSLGVSVALWFRSKREAVFVVASMGGAAIIMGLTKLILARPRPELFPDVDYWQTASPSFPSGHATGSAAFALTIFYVVRRLAPRWQVLAGVLGLIFCLGVSASRLYLQVHYPSDILAGIALGAAWVLGANAIYQFSARDASRRNVLLRLPSEVIDAYRAEAKTKGIGDDALVGEILARRYEKDRMQENEKRVLGKRSGETR